jgi:hypothetical protein
MAPIGGSPVMQRKRLNLLPRSENAPEKPASADETRSKSNPFGDARPVDTDSVIKKIEEKKAKEREQEQAAKGPLTPSSPTAPRHDKSRQNPKQLLRRSSTNPPTSPPAQDPAEVDVSKVVAEQTAVEVSEKAPTSWRKVESQSTPAEATPNDDEAGWETVPSRGKRVNGIGSKP